MFADDITDIESATRAVFHALESRLLLEKALGKASMEEAGYPELAMSLVRLDEKMASQGMADAVAAAVDEESMEALLDEHFGDLDDPWVVLDPECWWGVHRQLRDVGNLLCSETGQKVLARFQT
jgi:hypothetical protein